MVAPGATSLRRALAVLDALDSDEALAAGGLGVLRVAELIGSDKSQASRTLAALAGHGFVDRDAETRAYRLGWALFALAARAGDTRLLEAAEPIVAEVAGTLAESVHLTVLRGASVLTVLSQPAPHAIQAAGWVGRTVPAYCGSSGQALLLDCTREELEAALAGVELVQLAPNTPHSLDDLHERIETARERGYAVADEDFEAGLLAVAAPVRDFRGRIVAALNVSGPAFRLRDRVDEAGELVAAAAARVSEVLGARTLSKA